MPTDRDSILSDITSVSNEGLSYWSAFGTDAFFRRFGEAWSPAEHVRHLVKSTRPVMTALRMPKLVLRTMFGAPRRASSTYDALVTRYRERLDAGGEAGRFAPSPEQRDDLDAWRREILVQLPEINAQLLAATRRWSERALDQHQLPHPLLGKLTVREMLYFTLYHQRHHIAAAERRRLQYEGSAAALEAVATPRSR